MLAVLDAESEARLACFVDPHLLRFVVGGRRCYASGGFGNLLAHRVRRRAFVRAHAIDLIRFVLSGSRQLIGFGIGQL